MKPSMLRLSILIAVLLATTLTSCTRVPIDQAVYNDFKLNFLSPEEWDEELADIREDRREERIAQLRQVLIRVEKERDIYAERCSPFSGAESSYCESLEQLTQVLMALGEVESGLRTGQQIKGTLTQRLNYNLNEERLEERRRLVKRVERHFIPPPPKAE